MTPSAHGGPEDERILDVLAIGRACVDEILEVERYPPEDVKVPLLGRIREGGGQASTAACCVCQLEGRAGFVGVLGDDENGTYARERMAALGVDLSGTPPPRGTTPVGFCVISRSSGTRTILYEPSDAAPLTWSELSGSALRTARTLLVDPQAESLLPELLPFCRERGIVAIADAEHATQGWEETWGRVDVLAVSETFLSEAAPRGLASGGPGRALREVAERSRGSPFSIATLGARGAIALLGGDVVRIPAPRLRVRDTTGAGDVFHGALSLGLARGLREGDILRWAVAAASLSCRGLGGRSFPSAAEVAELWPSLPLTTFEPTA